MDFNHTDTQQEIADLAAQILGDHSAPETLRELERSGEPRFDPKLWAKLADADLLGIALPEPVGGAGLGLVELGCILTAAGRTAAAVPLWETLSLGADVLATFGSGDVVESWLRKVIAGEAVLTGAWHDPLGDALTPSATASGSGADCTVSGTKVCVPSGMIADAVVVAAVNDGVPGLYLVETSATGVVRVAQETTASTPEAEIVFEAAPAQEIATGADVLSAAHDRVVAAQCAQVLGTCEAALALLAEYTTNRKQFGVPIASFQAVGHRAADAYIDTEGIRLTTRQALWRLDNGMDAREQVAVAKFWAADGGQRVVHSAVHLHGGVGVDRDYPLPRFFNAAKQLELQLGGATPSLLRLGKLIAERA